MLHQRTDGILDTSCLVQVVLLQAHVLIDIPKHESNERVASLFIIILFIALHCFYRSSGALQGHPGAARCKVRASRNVSAYLLYIAMFALSLPHAPKKFLVSIVT